MGAVPKPDLEDFSLAPFPEQRGEQRLSLMLRMAKLVAPSGEYVCIIRDVSTLGLRLQLFHALPQTGGLELELTNGDRYPMELIWQSDAQAGFRFLEPVELSRFIEEPCPWPRRPLRLKLRRSALVLANGLSSPATVLDLSQNGARIELLGYFIRSQWLQIEIDGLPCRHATVRWHRGSAHGVMFEQPVQLDELAHFALMAQPFPAAAIDQAAAGHASGVIARLKAKFNLFA